MAMIGQVQYLGWRARRRQRALLRYGRLRAGELVNAKTGQLSGDRSAWVTDFRTEFACDGLSDDDIAYSLTYDPLGSGLDAGWPYAGINRAHAEIEALTTAVPEPDCVQAGRELIAQDEAGVVLATDVLTDARDYVRRFDGASLHKQTAWPYDDARFERYRAALIEAAS